MEQEWIWMRCPGGKFCLYNHFGGAKTLSSHVNLYVKNSVGGTRQLKISHLGSITPCAPVPPVPQCPPCLSAPRAYNGSQMYFTTFYYHVLVFALAQIAHLVRNLWSFSIFSLMRTIRNIKIAQK